MRNRQRQIWSDLDFIDRLEKIRAKRVLAGKPVKNIGQLTKEIIGCASFEQLERELVGAKDDDFNFNIKIDKRLFR